MQFLLRLSDGRDLKDRAQQVIVTDRNGSLLMLAYVANDVIVCGHHLEPSWAEFLADAGYSILERLHFNSEANLICHVQTMNGKVLALKAGNVRLYSEEGDPVAAVHWDKSPVCCHCADAGWDAYCSKYNIYQPRELKIVEA